jgi:two-component system cell cycle response regulator
MRGLKAGADAFLTKPVDDIALVKRVRNLARLKMLTDEMLLRASTEAQMGIPGALAAPFEQGEGAIGYEFIEAELKDDFDLTPVTDPAGAVAGSPGDFDLSIVTLNLEHAGGLKLCSQGRSASRWLFSIP